MSNLIRTKDKVIYQLPYEIQLRTLLIVSKILNNLMATLIGSNNILF
jgi:hypothetical protein